MFKSVTMARFIKAVRYACVVSIFSFVLPGFGQTPKMVFVMDPQIEGSVSPEQEKRVMGAIESVIVNRPRDYELIDRRAEALAKRASDIGKEQTSGQIDYNDGRGWQDLGKYGADGVEGIMCRTEITPVGSNKIYVKYTLIQGQRGRIIGTVSKTFSGNASQKSFEKLAKTLFK